MSHQDTSMENVSLGFGLQLREAIQWLVRPKEFAGVQFRRDCSWTAWSPPSAAMLWAWSDDLTLTDRFASARQIIQNAFGLQQELAGSYQAFLKMLVRWTATLQNHLLEALRRRMKRRFDKYRVVGWAIFGVDGSRIGLARTVSNQTGYCPRSALKKRKRRRHRSSRRGRAGKARQKKADSPQMWITTMWHCGSGLPWDWRTGRSDSSERGHLLEMIPALPAEVLCRVRRIRLLDGPARHGTPVRYPCRQQRQVAEEVGLRAGMPRIGLSLAGRRCGQGNSSLGVAAGRCANRQISGLSGHQHSQRQGVAGSHGGKYLSTSLGSRSLLPEFQANVRASQAPQSQSTKCPGGTRLVDGRAVGGLSLRSTLRRHAATTIKRRRRSTSLPPYDPPRRCSGFKNYFDATPQAGRSRQLRPQKQNQPRLPPSKKNETARLPTIYHSHVSTS